MGHCDEFTIDSFCDSTLFDFLQEPLKKKHTVEIDLEELFPYYDFGAASEADINDIRGFVIDTVANMGRHGFRNLTLPEKLSFGVRFFKSPEIIMDLKNKEFL